MLLSSMAGDARRTGEPRGEYGGDCRGESKGEERMEVKGDENSEEVGHGDRGDDDRRGGVLGGVDRREAPKS